MSSNNGSVGPSRSLRSGRGFGPPPSAAEDIFLPSPEEVALLMGLRAEAAAVVEEKKAEEDRVEGKCNLRHATADVLAGVRTYAEAVQFYGVVDTTLRRHVAKAEKGEEVAIGRPPLLSEQAVAEERKKARAQDMRKNSLRQTDGAAYVAAAAKEHRLPGTILRNGQGAGSEYIPDPRTVRKYLKKIVPETATGYQQNLARSDALNEPYNGLAFMVALRLAFGYYASGDLIGRDEHPDPKGKDPESVFNVDASSTDLTTGEEEPLSLRLAEGSLELLIKRHRSAATTKTKKHKPTQNRSFSYMPVVGYRELVAFIVFIKDTHFGQGSIQIVKVCYLFFKSPFFFILAPLSSNLTMHFFFAFFFLTCTGSGPTLLPGLEGPWRRREVGGAEGARRDNLASHQSQHRGEGAPEEVGEGPPDAASSCPRPRPLQHSLRCGFGARSGCSPCRLNGRHAPPRTL